MINGKNNQLKTSLIIFFCMIFLAVISTIVTAGNDASKTKKKNDTPFTPNKECLAKLQKIHDISTDPLPTMDMVQPIFDTYRTFATNDACKTMFMNTLKTFTTNLNEKITVHEKSLSKKTGDEIPNLKKEINQAKAIVFILKETVSTTELKKKLKEKDDALLALSPDNNCLTKLQSIPEPFNNSLPDIKIIQAAIGTYRTFKTDDVCKPAFENKLKNFTKALNDKITFYEKALLIQADSEISNLKEKMKSAKEIFLALEEIIPTAELKEELIITFEDHPAFTVTLYGGIESQSVGTITSPDIPRFGLLVYQSNNNDKRKGFHMYGNFMLTGSAETTETADNAPEQTLEMNFNVFYAYFVTNLDDKYALIGPVVSVGALKTDAKNEIHMPKKRYIGLRSALNPETYAEVLYGTTSGLKSKRLELRMQAPIARFQNGSRIFIGGVFNMAYDKRIDGEPESASIYLSWHVPFGELWNVNND